MKPRQAFVTSVVIALASAGARAGDPVVLVPNDAVWKYLDDGSDQGTAWREPSFDDGSWAQGPAQLGYGDGDEDTVVGYGADPAHKHVTTWFRHSFQIADPAAFAALQLDLLRDDGAVVYLNGAELARSNMPAGAITFETLAASTVSDPQEDAFYPYFSASTALVPGTNVLCVEVHQVDESSSDISLELALAAIPQLSIVRGPYLQLGTPESVRVRWRTQPAADARVWYGLAPDALTQEAGDAAVVIEHELELAGLAPATRYYYAVGTSAGPLAGGDLEHGFVTPPPTGTHQAFRAWILGDSGTADENAALVRDAYYAFAGDVHTDLWLMLGDNAYLLGLDEEYQAAVFDMYPEMLRKSVLWPTRGNRDTQTSVYYGSFTLPSAGQAGGLPSGTEAYYAFDHANVHFVCLDSQGSDRSVGGAMWTWLDLDLASTAQDWIVAFWHHPPYSKGSHDSDSEPRLIEMRENFLPLLESHGVDLVLCGHSHSYERSFLIDGHYGDSTSFGSEHQVDSGDGRPEGTGAYAKAAGPHAGAVYTVAGSSGQESGGDLDHPAMFHSVSVLGSVVLDVDGGRMDVRFLDADGAIEDSFTILNEAWSGPYCISAPHSQGCAARIGSSGTPSASDPAPFDVSATLVRTNQPGLLFYGSAPASLPFGVGELCVAPPIVRTSPQHAGGSSPCAGEFHFDFNARIQSGIDPELAPGTTVYCQYWFRDPGSAAGTALTDALQFTIEP